MIPPKSPHLAIAIGRTTHTPPTHTHPPVELDRLLAESGENLETMALDGGPARGRDGRTPPALTSA